MIRSMGSLNEAALSATPCLTFMTNVSVESFISRIAKNIINELVSNFIHSFIPKIDANECRQRRGSVGSLDSGMSISFQTTLNVQKSSRVSDYSDPSLMLEESLNNLSRASNCSS